MATALYTYAMDYADVDTAMDEVYRLHPSKAQFTRLGDTAKWFRPRSQVLEGNRFHFKAFTTPFTGTRQSDFATAAQGEFPVSRDISYTELSYAYTDLSVFQLSVRFNELAERRTQNKRHAVYRLANKLVREADMDAGEKLNIAIHQNSACQMALVSGMYSAVGGSYSSSRYAFMKIKNGSIGKFHKGMILDIGGESNVEVLDVIHGNDGPHPYAGGTRIADIGPGLQLDYTSGNTADSSANDAITRSGETTSDSFNGFPGWFSGSTNVYNNSSGTAIDRDLAGNAWSIPEIILAATAGSEVAFDMDIHLAELADILPQRVKCGRKARPVENDEESIAWASTLVAITTHKICNEATRDAKDNQRFTSTAAMSLDEAQRKTLFGTAGFEGMVWHSASLGSVAIQPDAAAEPFKVRIVDPNSWFWLTMGAGQNGIEWLRQGNGTRFMRVRGATNRTPTFYQDAGAWTAALLACDQPGANAEVIGVKSSLY